MTVYKITNNFDEKIYVGCTRQKLEKRWIQHKSMQFKKIKEQNKLIHAFKKYGFENFKIEIIETCETITEMSEKEQFWINFYDAINKGYNVSNKKYGERYLKKEHYATLKRKIFSMDLKTGETEEYESLATSGFSPSKISQCANEAIQRKSYKNKLWSYINEKENWIRLKGKEENKCKKNRVLCIETGTEYESIKEAQKMTGIHNNAIRNVVKGRAKTAGNYT